jgi:organic hydroperoxide reductase OsmC/OhrA
VPTKVKRSEYAIAVDRAGRLTAEGRGVVDLQEPWTPEHLVLAGLAICSVTSLRYHARRADLDLVAASSASGTVTRREEDGAYAFVEIECRIEAELEPVPPGDELTALLAKAERGCFVGASLTAKPRYRWVVNGREIE